MSDQIKSTEVEGLATPRPSDLAVAISQEIGSTADHAEAIDRVIAEHSIICCSYCGGNSYKGLAVVDGQWTDECREAMTDHILTCEKRPEKVLLDIIDSNKAKIEALTAAAKKMAMVRAEYMALKPDTNSACFTMVEGFFAELRAALALIDSPDTKKENA